MIKNGKIILLFNILFFVSLAFAAYRPIHQHGLASWYGPKFNHKKTASGERFNMYQYTAASRSIPLDTLVKVKNVRNGKSIVVKVNDRGPYVHGRILDLSYGAARRLGMVGRGVTEVEITAV
ncbi:MAG: septal ring lytic transglycosylase RlpA family protein [Legionellales bacterium]|nr:septal ring lytic transglycosylase RlpA family protein [Legionellales bacterium]